MDYQVNNHLNLKGAQIKDGRFELLSQTQIDAIPLITTADKTKQIGRKLYNTTTKTYMHYDEKLTTFINDGTGEGGLNPRGKLDCSIDTSEETATLKKNPPALANCKKNDYWLVAKSGVYTYIDADGNTKTQKAENGDYFQVIVKTPAATPDDDDILDWMYVESSTSELELIINYDSENPDTTSWEFVSYSETAGSVLYDIWKLGYNADMYKETTTTGSVSGGEVITRIPIFDKPTIIKDSDTYSGKTVYVIKVEFLNPLTNGEKYIIVLK